MSAPVRGTGRMPRLPGPAPATGRSALPHRARAASLMDDLETDPDRSRSAVSPGEVVKVLTGRDHLWWKCCREALLSDPGWLFQQQSEQWRTFINDTVADDATTGPNPADSPYLVARALAAPPDGQQRSLDALAPAAQRWRESGLLSAGIVFDPFVIPDQAMPDVPERVRSRLARLQSRAEDPAEGTLGVLALLLAGARFREHRAVRVSVVFGRSDDVPGAVQEQEDGVTGVLELRELPGGPKGLFPDPLTMAGVRSSGPAFGQSLAHAWQASPWRAAGRCVVWRITLTDQRSGLRTIGGGSLGVAFALGLRELFRRPLGHRPSLAGLRAAVYGFRSRTAVTGRLDADQRIQPVGGLDGKLRAVGRKDWRLVAPEGNRSQVSQPPPPGLRFAATLKQAEKYARQWRTGRLLTVAVVIAVAVGTGVVVSTMESADAERRNTAARLADLSSTLIRSDVGLAQLFAAQAYHYDKTPETRAALFRSVTASPHRVTSLAAGGTVSATAASGDGHTIVAGTADGSVVAWSLPTDPTKAHRRTVARLDRPVLMIATDEGGRVGAAIDDRTLRIWPATRFSRSLRIPAEERPAAVAVSPSGRYVAAVTDTEALDSPRLRLLDLRTGDSRSVVLDDLSLPPSSVTIPDDGQVVLFDGGYGAWQRRTLPGLDRTGGSTVGFGTADYAAALSADGKYFTYTNADTWLPLWRTSGRPNIDRPALVAETRGKPPLSLALSADGSRAAQAADTTIYVAPSVQPDQDRAAPTELTGAGPITRGTLAFIGSDSERLLSASGDLITLWDLSQRSRIGVGSKSFIPSSCNACSSPWIAVRPDGRHVAVTDGNGTSLTVQRLGANVTRRYTEKTTELGRAPYSPPLWSPDGKHLIVISAEDDSARIVSTAAGHPVTGTWAAPDDPLQLADPPASLRYTPDGRSVVEVTGSGTVLVREATTGAIRTNVPGPAHMAPTANGPTALPPGYAAIQKDAGHAAVIDFARRQVRVVDIADGRVRKIRGSEPTGVAFVGDDLLIQRKSGELEVWNAAGSTRTGTLRGLSDLAAGPVTNDRDTIVEMDSEGVATFIDYPSGHLLGTLPLPEGTKPSSVGLAFSPDGDELVSATEADGNDASTLDIGQIYNWQTETDAWLHTACSSAGRELTEKVWRQHTRTPAPSELRCPG
ncbi:hypothetical protein ACFS5L_34360 [Streptomyces phyllanthi]|uniref:WD40 repeat domain-containing protein n=1 Tax=Streptomyces phyllanthi TaxID=1803180 RepID=A0A5N8W2M6_9ACTN|nr:hypothetical protein [Streptomyces phyllanthi]MPY40554.1 hypothetical protein [Streptomyces phyllanthi]